MKIHTWLAAAVLALALPAAARAQQGHAGREPGYMGIFFGWDSAGTATVEDVADGSPAARAGVRRGDVVLRLNGRAPTQQAVDALRERLSRGDSVRLHLRHDGREEDRLVVAAARPDHMVFVPGGGFGRVIVPGDHRIVISMDTIARGLDSLETHMDRLRHELRMRHGDSIVIHLDTAYRILRDSLMRALPRGELHMRTTQDFPFFELGSRSIAGAEFTEMNPGLARYFHTSEGLLVTEVAPETPAARGGLQSGDVVLEANGGRVRGVRDLREAFGRAAGQELRLTVLRDGRRQQLSVRWEGPDARTYRMERSRRPRP